MSIGNDNCYESASTSRGCNFLKRILKRIFRQDQEKLKFCSKHAFSSQFQVPCSKAVSLYPAAWGFPRQSRNLIKQFCGHKSATLAFGLQPFAVFKRKLSWQVQFFKSWIHINPTVSHGGWGREPKEGEMTSSILRFPYHPLLWFSM